MTRRHALVLALVASAAPMLAVGSSAAQFSGRPQFGPLWRPVLVSGAGDLSAESIAVVASSLVQRLKKDEPDAQITYIQLAASPDARISDDMLLYSLTLSRERDAAELDEAQMDVLWHRVRKDLEQSLRVVQEAALMDLAQGYANRIDSLEVRRAQYKAELDKAFEESAQLDGDADGAIEEAATQLVDAVKRLRELQLDSVSIDARREAIETRIDELRQQGKANAGSDPIVAELRKIVEIRDGAIARLRELQSAGVVSGDGVALQDAETALAEARIELLRAERAATGQASGALLGDFNDELSKLYVQDAEVRARIKSLEALAGELRQRTSLTTRRAIDDIKQRIQSLHARYKSADQEITELRERKAVDVDADSRKRITIRPLEEVLEPPAPPAEAEQASPRDSE